jgi:hypothetical protein
VILFLLPPDIWDYRHLLLHLTYIFLLNGLTLKIKCKPHKTKFPFLSTLSELLMLLRTQLEKNTYLISSAHFRDEQIKSQKLKYPWRIFCLPVCHESRYAQMQCVA